MLEVVGIESYYTLVRAGRNTSEIIRDFPSNQFNHAILCAVVDSDTVWLECTNQQIPFGYLGSFTDDRDVLIINENGGNLVRTKTYLKEDNQQLTTANLSIDNYGDCIGTIITEFKGLYYDKNLQKLRADHHDRKKLIRNSLYLPDFILNGFKISESREQVPSIFQDLELSINGCGTIFGNRMAINLNVLNKVAKIPSEALKNRKSEIVIRRSFIEKDSVTFNIPGDLKVEKISKNKTIKSEFGELTTEVYQQDSIIRYIRTFEMNKGEYPAVDYANFVAFYKAVKKADKDRLILTPKSN